MAISASATTPSSKIGENFSDEISEERSGRDANGLKIRPSAQADREIPMLAQPREMKSKTGIQTSLALIAKQRLITKLASRANPWSGE
jgi:hypothetical protein